MNLKALLLALSLLSLIVLPTILPANAGITVPNPDTYTYLTTGGAETCDPAWAYDTASAEIIFNVYMCLVDFNFVYYDQFVEELSDWWPGKGETEGDVITPLDPACWEFTNLEFKVKSELVDIYMPIGSLWEEIQERMEEHYIWLVLDWIDNGNLVLDVCDTLIMANTMTDQIVTFHVQFMQEHPGLVILEICEEIDLADPVSTKWERKCIEWHLKEWVDNGNGILDYCDYVTMSWCYDPLWAAAHPETPEWGYENLTFHVDDVLVLCGKYYTLRLQPTFLDSTWKFHIRKGVKWQDPAYGTVTPFDVEVSLERGMLMDHAGGPQWMFFEPLTPQFGTRSSGWNRKGTSSYKSYKPDGTKRVARWIDDGIESDEEFVIFNLDQPYIPFMQILCQSWGSVMCADWLRDVGAWNMSWHCPCNTYRGYDDWVAYNNPLEPGPVGDNSMGSGPYYIDYIDLDTGYHRLKSFDNYYFGWDRAHCDTIIHEVDLNWATRKARFLSDLADQADQVTVLRGDVNDPELLAAIDACKVRYLPHLATLSADAIFWSYDFDPTSPYMHHFGDGTTAEAIPSTVLLSDEHMRYALNYCWNATQFIEQYYQGEAATLHNPIIYGIAYVNTTKHTTMYYPLDLAEATYHFKMAWGGTDPTPNDHTNGDETPGYIWKKGFHITMVPFPIAAPRTMPCTMIEYVVENLIPWEGVPVDVEVFPLGWSEGLTAMYSGLLGAYVVGWLADFPHPHNWVMPFEHSEGDFSYFQNINYGHQDLYLVNATAVNLAAPICSQWYLMHGFGEDVTTVEYHLGDWTDNGNGTLDECDYVDLAVKCDDVPLDYYEYHVESVEQDGYDYVMHVRRAITMNWHPDGNYGQNGLPYTNYNGDLITEISTEYVDGLIATGIGLSGAIAERCYTELMDIYYAEDASRMTYQPEGRRYERTWVYGWFYNSIYPGLMFYGPPHTMNLFKVDPQIVTCNMKPSWIIWWRDTLQCWEIHIIPDVCWLFPEGDYWLYPENFELTITWWDKNGDSHTYSVSGWIEANAEWQGTETVIPAPANGVAVKSVVEISPWVGHYKTDHDLTDNTLTAQSTKKHGDLGGGVPAKFFKFDGLCDAKDFSLFLRLFRGENPFA